MFSCSYKKVIDPADLEPVLMMVTTSQRRLRKSLRKMVNFTVRRVEARPWFGIPMTYMVIHCADQADYDVILKWFPFQRISMTEPK